MYSETEFIFDDEAELPKLSTKGSTSAGFVYLTTNIQRDLVANTKPIISTATIVQGKNVENVVNPIGYFYNTRADVVSQIGNVEPGSIFKSALRNAAVGALSGLGNPMTHQFTSVAINKIANLNNTNDTRQVNLGAPFSSMPFTRKADIENWMFGKYKDFRAFKGYVFSVDDMRLDGASAATRNLGNQDVTNGNAVSAVYAAAAATPGGVYKLFNLESVYGWGNHGDTNALRRDFTARSQVATRWASGLGANPGSWLPTKNPIEMVTEFRGDKINVIDFSERKLSDVYRWKPPMFPGLEKWNKFVSATDLTKDFIKFYFTGPKLQNGLDLVDDIMVFRAIIDTFSDTHSPTWSAVQMIGRADPNYMYTGYSRDISLSFTVYATSRDEMKPIYRKLNALAGYTVPDYINNTSIAMKSPWLRMTIGDLLVQQPVIINSLDYTFIDSDTTWEINVENDPTMMQAPHKVSVSLGLHVLSDTLPQKNGRMYTLAKQFEKTGVPIEGGDNWLSDTHDNARNAELERRLAASQQPKLTVKTEGAIPPAGPLTEEQAKAQAAAAAIVSRFKFN
jgi:hypothetical protein